MGMYDTFCGCFLCPSCQGITRVYLQTKELDNLLGEYEIGDEVLQGLFGYETLDEDSEQCEECLEVSDLYIVLRNGRFHGISTVRIDGGYDALLEREKICRIPMRIGSATRVDVGDRVYYDDRDTVRHWDRSEELFEVVKRGPMDELTQRHPYAIRSLQDGTLIENVDELRVCTKEEKRKRLITLGITKRLLLQKVTSPDNLLLGGGIPTLHKELLQEMKERGEC